jgi:hypothetical protein
MKSNSPMGHSDGVHYPEPPDFVSDARDMFGGTFSTNIVPAELAEEFSTEPS